MPLLAIAVFPISIILVYIYIRDKYEKEPIKILILGTSLGALSAYPILKVESFILMLMPLGSQNFDAFYNSFIVASLTEETFKFLILVIVYWANKNYNERFDGIVYGVFVSLGFALIENVLYIFNPIVGGIETGMARAIFSVPAHGFFGVSMGYYLSISKFGKRKKSYFLLAFLVPFIIHGLYDFILLSQFKFYRIIFYVFLFFLWFLGFKKMEKHINASPFKIDG